MGFQVNLPEQELRDRTKVKDSIKINLRYIADHAYLLVKSLNSKEHTVHQDLHSLLPLLLLAQVTQELSSTYEKPEMGLLRILQGSNVYSLFPKGEGPSKMG